MRSLTIKAAAFLVFCFGLAIEAKSADFDTQAEALAACEAHLAATNTGGSQGWEVCDQQCANVTAGYPIGEFIGHYQSRTFVKHENDSECPTSWNAHSFWNQAFRYKDGFSCEAGEGAHTGEAWFYNQLEPPAQCGPDGCIYEPTTGNCSDNGSGGYWCVYTMDNPGGECTGDNDKEELPENCAYNNSTGAISCDCSEGNEGSPACYQDEGPDPEEPPLPPNCIEVGDTRVCEDWPQHPAPPPEEDPPPGCYVTTHGVMYCPPGQDPDNPAPDPQNPIDTGDPGSSDGPGDSSDGPGTPGEDGPEESCTPGVDCPAERTAETKGGCDDGPPSCSGDPINCAILIQNWKTSCGALDTGDNSPPWEDDPDWGRDLKSEATELTTYEMIDDSGMGGGSCPANRTVAVMNISFELNMEGMCDLAAILKVFVIIAAWIQAAYLLTRAF